MPATPPPFYPLPASLLATRRYEQLLVTPSARGVRGYWVEIEPEHSTGTLYTATFPDGDDGPSEPAAALPLRDGRYPFDVRTSLYAYGGRAYAAEGRNVLFNDLTTNTLYYLQNGKISRLTTPEENSRWGNPALSGHTAFAVREVFSPGRLYPRSELIEITIPRHRFSRPTLRPIFTRDDFISSPAPSPDCTHLAFVSWHHPHMPWQESTLQVMDLQNPHGYQSVPLPGACLHPQWVSNDLIVFLNNSNGYWNFYAYSLRTGQVTAWQEESLDSTPPPWRAGIRGYGLLTPTTILTTVFSENRWGFATLTAPTNADPPAPSPHSPPGRLSPAPLPWNCGGEIAALAGHALVLAESPTQEPRLLYYRLAVNEATPEGGFSRADANALAEPLILGADPKAALAERYATPPQLLEDPGGEWWGWYFPPATAPDGAPPAVVNLHGGPTAVANGTYRREIGFFTSRGIGFFDLNYRGSWGRGNAGVEALAGQWGVVDAADARAACQALITAGLANPERCALRGSSAGGFSVLRALLGPHPFSAATVLSAPADPATVARKTHKFESQYLQWLIGEPTEFTARSVLQNARRLNTPVLFIHGQNDPVVPAGQIQQLYREIRDRGVRTSLLLYENEGHGLTSAENMAAAYNAEVAFYLQAWGLS